MTSGPNAAPWQESEKTISKSQRKKVEPLKKDRGNKGTILEQESTEAGRVF